MTDAPTSPWRTKRGRLALALLCLGLPIAIEFGTGYEPQRPPLVMRARLINADDSAIPNDIFFGPRGDMTRRWSQVLRYNYVSSSTPASPAGTEVFEATLEVRDTGDKMKLVREYRRTLDPNNAANRSPWGLPAVFNLRDESGALPPGNYRSFFILRKPGSTEPDYKCRARVDDFRVLRDDEIPMPPPSVPDEQLQFVGLRHGRFGVEAVLELNNTWGESVDFDRASSVGGAPLGESLDATKESRVDEMSLLWRVLDGGRWDWFRPWGGGSPQTVILPAGVRTRLVAKLVKDMSGIYRFQLRLRGQSGRVGDISTAPIEILLADIERALAMPTPAPTPRPTPAP